MRGIFSAMHRKNNPTGIIPAGAGHLLLCFAWSFNRWDHPRRCGAFTRSVGSKSKSSGSSPQVRGILGLLLSRQFRFGIIPAGAGHLRPRARQIRADSDHPRRCGAFSVCARVKVRVQGSSPQVRGISNICAGNTGYGGIIPAGAGHFKRSLSRQCSPGDHPRRCGAF